MLTLFIGATVATLVMLGFAPKMFRATKAQVGKLVRLVHEADPLALYQQTVDDATDQLREAKQGLEKFKANLTRVRRNHTNLADDCRELDTRIKKCLKAGDEASAQRHAQTLSRKMKALQESEGTLRIHEESYEKARGNVEMCKHRIQDAKERGKEFGARLKLAEAEAAIADMTPSLTSDNLGLSRLDEATALIEERIDRSRAKVEVQADLGGSEDYAGQALIEEQDGVDLLEHYKNEIAGKGVVAIESVRSR